MIRRNLIQTTRACAPINNVFIALVVVMLLAGIAEADRTAGLQSLQHSFTEIQNAIHNLQNQLIPLLKQCESFNKAEPKLQGTVESLGDECAARQKRLDELEKQIAKLKAALESKSKGGLSGNQSIEELENKLKEAEKQHDRLKDQKSKLLEDAAQCKEQQGRGVNKPAPDMNAVFAMIYDNCVVPIDEPYYKFESVLKVNYGQIVRDVRIERVRDGEPISDAIKPGGCLDSLLSKIDPTKEYTMFLVCPDSISAFRIVAKKAKECGVRCAWKPGKDTTLTFGGKPGWPD